MRWIYGGDNDGEDDDDLLLAEAMHQLNDIAGHDGIIFGII